MSWDEFKDIESQFVVVCFVLEGDWERHRTTLEDLGNQKNVKLVVQPCPFEGIEFLFRIDADLLGDLFSFDTDIYWKALRLKTGIADKDLESLSTNYHNYFCAVLAQDGPLVRRCAQAVSVQLKQFSGS